MPKSQGWKFNIYETPLKPMDDNLLSDNALLTALGDGCLTTELIERLQAPGRRNPIVRRMKELRAQRIVRIFWHYSKPNLNYFWLPISDLPAH